MSDVMEVAQSASMVQWFAHWTSNPTIRVRVSLEAFIFTSNLSFYALDIYQGFLHQHTKLPGSNGRLARRLHIA